MGSTLYDVHRAQQDTQGEVLISQQKTASTLHDLKTLLISQQKTASTLHDLKTQMLEMKHDHDNTLHILKTQMLEMKHDHDKFNEDLLALLAQGIGPEAEPELGQRPYSASPDWPAIE